MGARIVVVTRAMIKTLESLVVVTGRALQVISALHAEVRVGLMNQTVDSVGVS